MIITPLCQRIIVRYARKPIWMPTANSKLFRIAEHTFYNKEEVKKIGLLHNAYKAQEASIREFMEREFYIPATQSGGLPADFIKREAEIDKQLFKENDLENARVAKLKEEIIGKQLRELEERIRAKKAILESELIESSRKADEYVLKMKSTPNSFVTPDNIEAMIELAISNPVSYEFFIDTSGRKTGPSLNDNNSVDKHKS